MSEEMTRTEFENLMDEYLRSELSQPKQLAFDEYLDHHPEARSELEEVRSIQELTAEVVHHNPPARLAEEAGAGLLKQLNPTEKKKSGWYRRPLLAWSLAASLLIVVGLTLLPTDSSFVYARLIESLKKIESVKVEGWIRGENGVIIPYRQWVVADGTLRAELGDENHQRIVVLKGNERLIKDYNGQLYQDNTKVRRSEDLEAVFSRLQATHQSSNASQSSFEYSKEDLGDVVRFKRRDQASLGRGPSNRKWIMEVDKKTALPTLLQLHQQVDGRWIQIFDLRFSEFNSPPTDDHFYLDGTQIPLTNKKRLRFWFELYISPNSIQMPAVLVPDGGMQLYWPTAEEMPEGISSGVSNALSGGITISEFRNMRLSEIVKSLTSQRVLINEVAEQRVSLLFSSKAVLPWQEKLVPVLEHLGLRYEMVPIVSIQRRYIFGQNGQKIQTTLHRFENNSVHADSTGFKYSFEKTSLQFLARRLLGNCDPQGAFTDQDTLLFVWDGDPEENPFEWDVDLVCEIPQATFESNVEFLKEHFGLTMKMEKKEIETMEIRLIRN